MSQPFNDETYMRRCIELAQLGAGMVAPNPMVGSVLVCDDKIIGEGYHAKYGQAHAEVNCIRNAELRMMQEGCPEEAVAGILQRSRLYVSLEPCAHYGKTPPCADLIILKKITSVIVGCRDPFPLVDGKGIEKLQRAGINVRTGIMQEACTLLNKRFFTFHTKRRPYIVLKWAQTSDQKIAGKGRQRIYISNPTSNRLVHKWRSEEASILVGTNTALIDDPALTTRLWTGNNPIRLVVDMNLRLPESLRIFNDEAQTILFNALRAEQTSAAQFYRIDPEQSLVQEICNALYQLNIQSVLVEGGKQLLESFIEKGLWDEARIITGDKPAYSEGLDAPQLKNGLLTATEKIMTDTVQYFRNG